MISQDPMQPHCSMTLNRYVVLFIVKLLWKCHIDRAEDIPKSNFLSHNSQFNEIIHKPDDDLLNSGLTLKQKRSSVITLHRKQTQWEDKSDFR